MGSAGASFDRREPSSPHLVLPETRPIRAFFAAVAVGAFLYIVYFKATASDRSLYMALVVLFPPLAFLYTAFMAAIALGVALVVVGGLLAWVAKFTFWPLLVGVTLLGVLVYIGLPLAINPAVHKDISGFLGRAATNIAIIDAMVCCFWLVRRAPEPSQMQSTNAP